MIFRWLVRHAYRRALGDGLSREQIDAALDETKTCSSEREAFRTLIFLYNPFRRVSCQESGALSRMARRALAGESDQSSHQGQPPAATKAPSKDSAVSD